MLPWSPLGGGWLSGKYRRGTDRTWRVIDAVQQAAEDRGVPMAEVAVAWVTARPGVRSTILGARPLKRG